MDTGSPYRRDGFSLPLDSYFIRFGAGVSAVNLNWPDGRSWLVNNDIELNFGGSTEKMTNIKDAFTLAISLGAKGQTVSHEKWGRNMSLNASLTVYFDLLQREKHYLRLGVAPVGIGFTGGVQVKPQTPYSNDDADWITAHYNPATSAMYLHRPTGIGVQITASGEVGIAGELKYGDTDSRAKLRFNAATVGVEGFWAPFKKRDSLFIKGLMLFAGYKHTWSKWIPSDANPARLSQTENSFDALLFGMRWNFYGSDSAHEDILFNTP